MTHNERVPALLRDGEPHTHHELYALHVIAHSRVSDLRARGYEIAQWRVGDDYVYQLVGSPGADGAGAHIPVSVSSSDPGDGPAGDILPAGQLSILSPEPVPTGSVPDGEQGCRARESGLRPSRGAYDEAA